MDSGSSEGSEARFAAYVEALGAALGHADRQKPMRDYWTPAMATTRGCERTSPLSTCATSQGSDPPPRYGRRARLPFRRDDASSSLSPRPSRDALVATPRSARHYEFPIPDAVRLNG